MARLVIGLAFLISLAVFAQALQIRYDVQSSTVDFVVENMRDYLERETWQQYLETDPEVSYVTGFPHGQRVPGDYLVKYLNGSFSFATNHYVQLNVNYRSTKFITYVETRVRNSLSYALWRSPIGGAGTTSISFTTEIWNTLVYDYEIRIYCIDLGFRAADEEVNANGVASDNIASEVSDAEDFIIAPHVESSDPAAKAAKLYGSKGKDNV